jgi:hypothetical protein
MTADRARLLATREALERRHRLWSSGRLPLGAIGHDRPATELDEILDDLAEVERELDTLGVVETASLLPPGGKP